MNAPARRYRAGESIEDFCRACKTDRMHTVIAADDHGQPIRVSCGFCHSEHNYRGGPRVTPSGPASVPRSPWTPDNASAPARTAGDPRGARPARSSATARDAFPIVSERERTGPPMAVNGADDLELL